MTSMTDVLNRKTWFIFRLHVTYIHCNRGCNRVCFNTHDNWVSERVIDVYRQMNNFQLYHDEMMMMMMIMSSLC